MFGNLRTKLICGRVGAILIYEEITAVSNWTFYGTLAETSRTKAESTFLLLSNEKIVVVVAVDTLLTISNENETERADHVNVSLLICKIARSICFS